MAQNKLALCAFVLIVTGVPALLPVEPQGAIDVTPMTAELACAS